MAKAGRTAATAATTGVFPLPPVTRFPTLMTGRDGVCATAACHERRGGPRRRRPRPARSRSTPPAGTRVLSGQWTSRKGWTVAVLPRSAASKSPMTASVRSLRRLASTSARAAAPWPRAPNGIADQPGNRGLELARVVHLDGSAVAEEGLGDLLEPFSM